MRRASLAAATINFFCTAGAAPAACSSALATTSQPPSRSPNARPCSATSRLYAMEAAAVTALESAKDVVTYALGDGPQAFENINNVQIPRIPYWTAGPAFETLNGV